MIASIIGLSIAGLLGFTAACCVVYLIAWVGFLAIFGNGTTYD